MHHFDSIAALAEVSAVKAHFRSVLWFLRQRRPPGLDPAQKVARALLLDELEAYAERGVFPLNTHFPGERKPAFIDEVGTRCAVAHLLEVSGEQALALSVRDRMNFASVSEIVEEPSFVAWLEAAGFTREEIALVQPSYCYRTSDCVCQTSLASKDSFALVSYRKTTTGTFVTEVHRGQPGVEVGARILDYDESPAPKATTEPQLSLGPEQLAWVKVPERDGAAEGYPRAVLLPRLHVQSDGSFQCQEWGTASLRLTKESAVKALLSPSPAACATYLGSLDDRWEDQSGDCGLSCTMSDLASSSPASLAVLAAIVGAIVARRRK